MAAALDAFAALNRVLEAPNTSAGYIRKACAAVEECLSSNRDNLRAFFDLCFPTLLRRVFGYDYEASWLNVVAKPGRESDAAALRALLSPTGRLFSAITSADADQLIQFIFPLERLPGHTQKLLKTVPGRAELERWPQYKGRVSVDPAGRAHVYLKVFEYYMFWHAYFLLRGNGGAAAGGGPAGGNGGGGGRLGPDGLYLEPRQDVQWSRSLYDSTLRLGSNLIAGLHHSASPSLQEHPYFALLEQYLQHFLPCGRGGAEAGGGSGGGAGGGGRGLLSAYGGGGNSAYGSGPGLFAAHGGGNGGGDVSHGAVLLSILVEFWLTDIAEPLPPDLPLAATHALAASASGKAPAATDLSAPSTTTPTGALAHAGTGFSPAAAGRGAVSPGIRSASVSAGLPASSPLGMLAYQPPSEEVLLGVSQLVLHVHTRVVPVAGGGGGARGGRGTMAVQPAQAGTPWLVETPIRTTVAALALRGGGVAAGGGGGSGSGGAATGLLGPPACAAVQAVSRKVYRLIRRTFAQWPLASSASLAPVIHLWLSVIAPWSVAGAAPPSTAALLVPPGSLGGAGASGALGSGAGAGAGAIQHLGSEISQRLHLGRAATDAHGSGGSSGGAAAGAGGVAPTGSAQFQGALYTPEWRGHVLAHLPFYTLLIPRFVELVYARLSFRGDAAAAEALLLFRVLAASGPELLRLLREVELATNRYRDSHRKRVSSGMLADLAPWLADQAFDWEAAAVAGAATNPPMQVDVEFRLCTIDGNSAAHFGAAALRAAVTQVRPDLREALAAAMSAVLPVRSIPMHQPAPAPTLEPPAGAQYPPAGHWQGVQYKGDWLRRPIASNEIPILVRSTVWLSEWLNNLVGLDQPWRGDELEEPPETVLHQGVAWLRKRRFRISLRFLSEIQVLCWLVGLYWLARVFHALFLAPGAAGAAHGAAPGQAQLGYGSGGGFHQEHGKLQGMVEQELRAVQDLAAALLQGGRAGELGAA